MATLFVAVDQEPMGSQEKSPTPIPITQDQLNTKKPVYMYCVNCSIMINNHTKQVMMIMVGMYTVNFAEGIA